MVARSVKKGVTAEQFDSLDSLNSRHSFFHVPSCFARFVSDFVNAECFHSLVSLNASHSLFPLASLFLLVPGS